MLKGLQRTEIARRTGIGVASVYRVLADAKSGLRRPKGGVVNRRGRIQHGCYVSSDHPATMAMTRWSIVR